ncbi:MAG: LPS export ABC transporter permease LptG [Desulfuromonas sp.]|nr:LPS export ABC transporter permease LptG [Desulfuromonas sp.]
MTILQRYLLTTFGKITGLALAAFTGIYLLVDFFEKVDDFLEHQAQASLYVSYFVCKTPLIISQVLPLTILMGVFLTLGGFTKTNELTAMRAGGIGLSRIITPFLIVATLLTAVNFTFNEYLVPAGTQKANHILHTEVKGKAEKLAKRDNLWFRDQTALYHVKLAIPETGQLRGVSIYQLDEKLRLQSRIEANKLIFNDDQWQAKNAVVRNFDLDSSQLTKQYHVDAIPLALNKTPDDFGSVTGKNEELNFSQLRRLSQTLQREGLDATRYRVDMHSRLASPFACLIMAFLAIPFALQKSRNVNLALGISVSVLIGISFFIVQSTLIALGYSAVLPPLIAAWAANIIFGLLGVFLILSTRD